MMENHEFQRLYLGNEHVYIFDCSINDKVAISSFSESPQSLWCLCSNENGDFEVAGSGETAMLTVSKTPPDQPINLH